MGSLLGRKLPPPKKPVHIIPLMRNTPTQPRTEAMTEYVEAVKKTQPPVAKTSIDTLNRNIKWTSEDEVLYHSSAGFIFVSEDYSQCHPIVTCKDYLGDMVFAAINDWEVTQTNGNFRYSTLKCPTMCLDKMRIIASNKADKVFSTTTIHASIDLVHQAERELDIPFSVIDRIRNPQKAYQKTGMFLFSGDAAWMISPPMLSFYTLLIRLGVAHKVGEPWLETIDFVASGKCKASTDSYICHCARKGIDRLIKEGFRNIFGDDIKKNYPSGLREGTTHPYFGIQAFSLGEAKHWCPHWYKTEKTGTK